MFTILYWTLLRLLHVYGVSSQYRIIGEQDLSSYRIIQRKRSITLTECCLICDDDAMCSLIGYDKDENDTQGTCLLLREKQKSDMGNTHAREKRMFKAIKKIDESMIFQSEVEWRIISNNDDYARGDDGFYYKYHNSSMNWSNAKSTCESEGARLPIIESSKTFEYIKKTYRQDTQGIWLGVEYIAASDSWRWLNGVAMSNDYWQPGEPNNYDGHQEDCVVMNYLRLGAFFDVGCGWNEPKVLCQKVDGSWGSWYVTDQCSVSCGGGVLFENRTCSNPTPTKGGSQCILSNGNRQRGLIERRKKYCNTNACPGKLRLINPNQSSTFKVNYATKALDGNPKGFGANGGCAETNKIHETQWWGAELTDQHFITVIRILPRFDCCRGWFTHVTTHTSIDNNKWITCADVGDQLKTVSKGSWVEATCANATSAKYVKIVLHDKELFALCEVEVWGYL